MTAQPKLQSPFPYFGGKSRIADRVWERFGASAALGPEDIGDEPDTDVEPPDGHEIDGISDPD